MTTSPPDTHPLVVAYLADLERVLTGADPQERADTLAAIREHIVDALDGASQDTATTMAVLADLGPVERIAATATPAAASAGTVASPAAPLDRRSLALLGCAVVSFALVWVLPWVATPIAIGALVLAVVHLRRDGGHEGFLRTSVVMSIATIVTAALLAIFGFSTGSPAVNVDDPQVTQTDAG